MEFVWQSQAERVPESRTTLSERNEVATLKGVVDSVPQARPLLMSSLLGDRKAPVSQIGWQSHNSPHRRWPPFLVPLELVLVAALQDRVRFSQVDQAAWAGFLASRQGSLAQQNKHCLGPAVSGRAWGCLGPAVFGRAWAPKNYMFGWFWVVPPGVRRFGWVLEGGWWGGHVWRKTCDARHLALDV